MQLKLGEKYSVTVQKILQYGIIVSMEDGSTEFIHISKISDKYVSDIADFVSVGDTYQALACVGKKQDVELTLAHLSLRSISAGKLVYSSKEFDCRLELSDARQHRPRQRRHRDSTYTHGESTKTANQNLDDMIAKSDTVFQDKFRRRLNADITNRRGNRRPRRRF